MARVENMRMTCGSIYNGLKRLFHIKISCFWSWSTSICQTDTSVRKLGNFRYILIPEIINKFMTNISDPVRTKHVHVFKLILK
jgi:hypothetical protein